MNWQPYIERYERELLESVIPFWEKHCVDHEFGGYFTCLDRDGSVYDPNKYMWMQWRIVYMFATLYKSEYGKGREDWLEIARRGYEFLVKHGRLEDGSYHFEVNRRGEPAMGPFSIFSDCFAAMGAAAMYQATGEAKYRQEAESAMASYIRRIPNPKGKYEKNLPGKEQYLSHGSYMILANLGCVMADCLGTDQYDRDCRMAIDTVMDKFFNPELQVIFENVRPDGSFDLDSCEGRFVNPGHGLESMWFMMRYGEAHGDRQLIERAAHYVDAQFKFGWDKLYGGIFYFMDALGKPHLELQHDMKLWWPHNEATIAALYAYRLTGEAKFLEYFKQVDEYSFNHFRDPVFGEWYAYLNRYGEPTHLLKGGKWKTFFHLPRCLLISLQQMKKMA